MPDFDDPDYPGTRPPADMLPPGAIACGPKPPSEADVQAIRDFSAFLRGDAAVCVVCLVPADRCNAPEDNCCSGCRHISLRRSDAPAD